MEQDALEARIARLEQHLEGMHKALRQLAGVGGVRTRPPGIARVLTGTAGRLRGSDPASRDRRDRLAKRRVGTGAFLTRFDHRCRV